MSPLVLLLAAAPRIELITMGPGDALYAFWGHSAIRVVDPELGTDVVYNFGSIDFSGPFFMRMLRGQVDAFVGVSRYDTTVRIYTGEDRTFERRVLNLPADRAEALAASLASYVRGGRRHEYRYHHFFDNCSTRVADEIDRALGGRISESSRASMAPTFRTAALDTIRSHTLYYVAIDLVITSATDRPMNGWEARFLPSTFTELLDRERSGDVPAVLELEVVHRPEHSGGTPIWPWVWIYAFVLVPVTLLIAARPRLGAVVWGLASGLTGVGIAAIWAVTNYDFTAKNWNLLVLPATHLLLAGAVVPRFVPRLATYASAHALLVAALFVGHSLGAIDQAIGPSMALAIVPSVLLALRLRGVSPSVG